MTGERTGQRCPGKEKQLERPKRGAGLKEGWVVKGGGQYLAQNPGEKTRDGVRGMPQTDAIKATVKKLEESRKAGCFSKRSEKGQTKSKDWEKKTKSFQRGKSKSKGEENYIERLGGGGFKVPKRSGSHGISFRGGEKVPTEKKKTKCCKCAADHRFRKRGKEN